MLRLCRVELFGFKSFSRRTQINFGGTGIAAIVGPNGCGKSNIADAILWVLGEQSPRTLRSGRMADCIFNGTATEPPTNLAEVTLTLLEPAAALAPPPGESPETPQPSEGAEHKRKKNRLNLKILPGEVVVTRRLYRSGASEYYLNGELCRLRDIQELFMGTGLGPESYAIIEQGRIGQILSSRPADRRALIEEAAGVSKYKTKRRLAEAKLQSAQQNLLRLNDIFEEVTKQLNSLKRQASRARRYQELKTETQRLRRHLLASRFEALRASEALLASKVEATAQELERVAATMRTLEQAQEQNQARSFELESSLRRQQTQAGQLILELERAQTRLADARRQHDELAQQLEEAARRQQVLARQVEQNATAVTANSAALEQWAAELTAARTTVQSLQTEQESLGQQIHAQEEQSQQLQEQHAACLNRLAGVRAEITQLEEIAPNAAEQIRQLALEREQTAQEKARLGEKLVRVQATVVEAQHALLHAQEQLRTAEEELAHAKQRHRSEKVRVEELRESLATAAAQQQVLAGLLAQRTAFAEPVQKLLSVDDGAAASGFRAVGVVADFAEFDSHYAPLLEEYLHDELEYVVVETYEAARSGVKLLRDQATGRATFLVDSFGRPPTKGRAWKLSEDEAAALHTGNGVIAPLTDLVRFQGPLGQGAARVLPRLSRTYLVRSAQVAEEMARTHPQLFFLSTDGTCYHGRLVSGGTRNGHGPVMLKRELDTAAQKRAELDPITTSVESNLRALEQSLEERERQLSAAQQSLFIQERILFQREQQLQNMTAERARWEQKEQQASAELQARVSERDTIAQRIAELTVRQKELTTQASNLEASVTDLREALQKTRQQATLEAGQLTEQSARLAALEERILAAQQEQKRLAAEREQWLAEQGKQEQLHAHLTRRWEEFAEIITRAEIEVQQREQEKHATEHSGEQVETELGVVRQKLLETDAQLRAARSELDAQRNHQHALDVERVRLETECRHVEASCQSEFGLTGTRLTAECPEPLRGEVLEQAEENYRSLKNKLENLGAINMMALEEFQECEQRHAFLAKQREDLLASIADTTRAIQEIDTVSAKQFEEAFAAINQNFAETFRTLFGGGSATLRLTNAENPGESGIDLICQPPGKRLQNVLLLSGGEKALAALALLIAIFRYQPSPFCILDEVDAPLDEANVGRFTQLIQEMSAQTQFILITHNKKTMEIAPVLYGVTMQNAISQIVSVRFEESVSTA
ncbi:MAG: chromosome segregation protein SMC, partial [Terriglobia bacterium]